ncbi:hypothetical protein BBD42_04690 [Paenibacillus sp. BIHB 4019]|uniref:DUF4367 domain-containing protein n=1 Tax=Paenibacillus sp. BIHB 4019 TaxID=1870819 RepID=A0A1B2DDP8_9BACL|nr:hypothetical protein [Paenibacillus sp. BIHB 4019]ANY65841.1 hypothetical protein BBD42_04690 [Paenibacillus sp. BIHB 4019]
MERIRFDHEYNDIKSRAAANGGLPAIDVTEAVMKRITGEAASGRKGQTSFMRPVMKRTTAFSGALMLLLLLSVSAYAASQYIEIRNAAGEIKVKTIDEITPQTGSAEDIADNEAHNNYLHKAQNFAKPGELVAFYVLGKEEEALYTYKEKPLGTYAAFKKEANRTGAQLLPQKLSGYSFVSGKVAPYMPNTDADKQTAAYKQVLSELKAQAAAGTNGQKLFMRAVSWNKPGMVSAIYTKGHYKSELTKNPLDGGNVYISLPSGQNAEKIKVEGIEVIYNKRTISEKYNYHYAQWYDEKQDAFYMLTDLGNKKLTKAELLALAGESIKVLK